MILIYEFAVGEDPGELSKHLWAHSIGHRIMQSDRGMQVWLSDPNHIGAATEVIQQWQQHPDMAVSAKTKPKTSGIAGTLLDSPVTTLILLFTAAVALLTSLGEDLATVSWFTITPFYVSGNNLHFLTLDQVLEQGQWWRLLTPAFLHFGVMHIVFNSLWIWDLGRKTERLVGKLAYLVGFVLVAVGSNLAQFVIDEYPVFGGLSGVVYGLVGFAWLLPLLIPRIPTLISKPLMVFFLIWLALGYTDLLGSVGLGNMANTAHLSGLAGGICSALLVRLLFRRLGSKF